MGVVRCFMGVVDAIWPSWVCWLVIQCLLLLHCLGHVGNSCRRYQQCDCAGLVGM
jgi:hypothetical protein